MQKACITGKPAYKIHPFAWECLSAKIVPECHTKLYKITDTLCKNAFKCF